MLPTPSTRHIPDSSPIYPPSEDSFLLLDTLSSATERAFLRDRFRFRGTPGAALAPLLLELGVGSGVVLAFLAAHAREILGRADVLALGVDVNPFACRAAGDTITGALGERGEGWGGQGAVFADVVRADLAAPVRDGVVDLVIVNPPYVPSESLPAVLPGLGQRAALGREEGDEDGFERDSRLIALATDGGLDGMEVTNRVLEGLPGLLSKERGVAYLLLCARNRPEEVKERVGRWGDGWRAETVGTSGRKGGFENLQIVRIWRAG